MSARAGIRRGVAGGALLLVSLVVALPLLAGCAGTRKGSAAGSEATSTTSPKHLGSVEVREYKGERLDPVDGFRYTQIGATPDVDPASYRLRVDGRVSVPASYTYRHIVSEETSHTKVVTLLCVEGWSVKILWEGVLLSDLIDRARPASDAVTVIFHAADGYTTSLPLAYVRSRRILLAYKQNGLEIPPSRGYPFQVVAEDRYGYKWCKWVTRIELSSNADYRGYWESRGYSNEGTLGGP